MIWRRFMMTPPLKLLSYSSSHQVCMCHGLNLWVNFSKIKNNILYFQNPLVILFLYIVYCCNSSTSKIKNSTLFHYRYRPPGTVSEVCGGAEGQCLAPGYDLPGARSRPQGRGADLKGPDSKGTLGVLTELSSGSLLHASATGHSRKVRVTNIMCLSGHFLKHMLWHMSTLCMIYSTLQFSGKNRGRGELEAKIILVKPSK